MSSQTSSKAYPRSNSSRFHDRVLKQVNREQQHLPSTEIPVQVTSSLASAVNVGFSAQQARQASEPSEHLVTLRGPSDAVGDLNTKLLQFLERERQDELERGHITSFDFPQKFANQLIGRRGETINKFRDEFDVDIQIADGKVEIKGPVAKADQAKAKIVALGKRLEDEATHIIKIRPLYHRDMIGQKGSQVNRLQNRYNVRVQFPRNAAAISDDRSIADGSSEVNGFNGNKSNQAPDEVIIRGPRRGADEARDELLNLLQWTIDNSHTSTVSVAQSQLPSLIGQGGREMENTRLATGAQIDVPNRDATDPSGRVAIQIKGTKKQVEEATKLFQQKAKVFDATVTKAIEVDKKYHRALIGGGGESCSRAFPFDMCGTHFI